MDPHRTASDPDSPTDDRHFLPRHLYLLNMIERYQRETQPAPILQEEVPQRPSSRPPTPSASLPVPSAANRPQRLGTIDAPRPRPAALASGRAAHHSTAGRLADPLRQPSHVVLAEIATMTREVLYLLRVQQGQQGPPPCERIIDAAARPRTVGVADLLPEPPAAPFVAQSLPDPSRSSPPHV